MPTGDISSFQDSLNKASRMAERMVTLCVLLAVVLMAGCGPRKVKIGNVAFLNCKVSDETVVTDHGSRAEYKSCDCPNGVLMWDAKRQQKVVKCGELQ